MNKWKIGFWVSIVALIIVTGLLINNQINQAFKTINSSVINIKTYQDLDAISKILSETNLSKPEIQNLLNKHNLYSNRNFNKDTVLLQRLNLIFKNNKLNKIVEQ